jgi:hypothetical protein
VLRAARDRGHFAIELAARPQVAASFLVDASGRAGVLSRGAREREPRFRTLALTAHYRDGETLAPTLVEAVSEGWIWSAPLDNGRRDVTVMLDGSAAAESAEALFNAVIASSRELRGLLGAAPRAGAVRGTDATPYLCRSTAGPDFAVVGDAASFLDPLAAHGVHKALDGALVAAAVVRTLLERPERVEDVVRFYRERERGIARVTAERLSRLYASERRFAASPFWRKRSSPPGTSVDAPAVRPRSPLRGEMSLGAAAGVRLAEAPVLEDDYVERREVLLAPAQERPVRFLGEVALPDVFREVIAGPTVAAAARRLRLPYERAFAAIDWLYRSGYLEQRR